MAPNRGRNRQPDFEGFAQVSKEDFDPEEDVVDQNTGDDSESDQEESGRDGREHYTDVGKSRLRKLEAVPLGPQYRGLRIPRQILDGDDSDDDALSRELEGAQDSNDEDSGLGSETASSDNSAVEKSVGQMNGIHDASSISDVSDEGEDGHELDGKRPGTEHKAIRQDNDLTAQLRRLESNNKRKAFTASLSQAGREEAEKGRAVKRQRAAFDSLLKTRLRMQKSLEASNTLVGISAEKIESDRAEALHALAAAEKAAFNLWDSLERLRRDLLAARLNSTSHRVPPFKGTSTEDFLAHLQAQEAESRQTRDSVLKKWSIKSQGPTVQGQSGRLNHSASQTTIVDVLHEQMTGDRFLKKTRVPRSCAPLQLAQRLNEVPEIYDDADFYVPLLKELIEQKSSDSIGASIVDLGPQMRQISKAKQQRDTKASKGRKLRYNEHEKLQNFMASEDRTTWGERQAEELFRSLFGQRLALTEVEEGEEAEDIDEATDAQEAGLLMFGAS